MYQDTIRFEVSSKLIAELYQLAGVKPPLYEIDDKEFEALIQKLKSKIVDKNPEVTQEQKSSSVGSVLVVDDLGLVVYQLSLILTKSGYNVILARSAPESKEIFEKHEPFDFILMDLFMPNKEDGIGLLTNTKNAIKEQKLKTKVIVMSSTKDVEAIKEVQTLGADYFIEKGLNWKNDLIELLEKFKAKNL